MSQELTGTQQHNATLSSTCSHKAQVLQTKAPFACASEKAPFACAPAALPLPFVAETLPFACAPAAFSAAFVVAKPLLFAGPVEDLVARRTAAEVLVLY